MQNAAQQSVHLTLGILRTSQAVSYALSFFWLDGFAVPAPAQVTQTVSPSLASQKFKSKMKYFLILFLSISVAACSQGFPIKETSTPAYPDLMVSMERGPCFGKCPVYNLTIDANGNVAYEGRLFVAVEGKRNAKISLEKIQELVIAIEKANFFELEDQYRAPATDLPSITLSISLNGQNKSVWHYGTLDCSGELDNAPQELCELENKIDEIINTKQWIE